MRRTMFVLVGVDTTGPEPVIMKFGPTSERADLLNAYDMCWPLGADTVVVVPTMGTGLLQVSKVALADALRAAGAPGEGG